MVVSCLRGVYPLPVAGRLIICLCLADCASLMTDSLIYVLRGGRGRGRGGDFRFAFALIPVYEDESDKKSSPFSLPNVEPFTWQWLSTINRVNSQVQKVRFGSFLCGVLCDVRSADGWDRR